MTSHDLVTASIRVYEDKPCFGIRKLGPGRCAIDFGTVSLILEFWFIRKEGKSER